MSARPKISQMEQRANAAAFRVQLLALLKDHGSLSVRALSEMTGANANTIRDYMHKLVNEGQAVSDLVPNSFNARATVMAVYRLGDEDEVPIQITCRVYPLHHVRDELHTYLFGPAKQQQGATK